jgi:hypothetical protein
MVDHQLVQQFRKFGVIRAMSLRMYVVATATSNEDDADNYLSDMFDYVEGAVLIGRSIGLEVDRQQILPRLYGDDEDLANVLGVLIDNALLKDKIFDKIDEAFGRAYAFEFQFSQLIALTLVMSLFRGFDLRMAPKARRDIIAKQRNNAHEFLDIVAEFLVDNLEVIKENHSVEFTHKCVRLSQFLQEQHYTLTRFSELEQYAVELVAALVPHFAQIKESLGRARILIGELADCPAGLRAWTRYEDICIRSLRMLFVPPFRNVMIQARSADGHERRDAILPNNQFSGFWKLVKDEFESRHVVCEFKNLKRTSGKHEMHQLRIYLSKSTIGRFGLLFTRSGIDDGFKQAQRDAYEQNRILVLPITDEFLALMLKARAFNGSADFLLEESKANFEVRY